MLDLANTLPYILGGIAISAAVKLDLKLEKRVPSPSTTIYNLITLDSYSKWRTSFISGFMLTSLLLWNLSSSGDNNSKGSILFESQETFLSGINSIGFLISGFLVGVGSKLADGGFTKFAFYGVPRKSKRAFIAMGLIFAIGGLIATLRSRFPFFDEGEDLEEFAKGFNPIIATFLPILMLVFSLYRTKGKLKDELISFGVGCLLSLGVMLSGLAQRHKMIKFLTFTKDWDPFFLYVMVAVIASNAFLFNVFLKHEGTNKNSIIPSKVDRLFVLGCCFLGAGLGISGLTPGSALLVMPVYLPQIALFFLPFVALGQYCALPMGEWMVGS